MDSKYYKFDDAKKISVLFGDNLCFLIDSTYVNPEQILHTGETVSRVIYNTLQEFSLKSFSFVKDIIVKNIQFWLSSDVFDQLKLDPEDIDVYLGVMESGPYIKIDVKSGPYIQNESRKG